MTKPHDPLYEPHLDGQDGDLDGGPGERVAKALARAGVASRRVDGLLVAEREPTRIFR